VGTVGRNSAQGWDDAAVVVETRQREFKLKLMSNGGQVQGNIRGPSDCQTHHQRVFKRLLGQDFPDGDFFLDQRYDTRTGMAGVKEFCRMKGRYSGRTRQADTQG